MNLKRFTDRIGVLIISNFCPNLKHPTQIIWKNSGTHLETFYWLIFHDFWHHTMLKFYSSFKNTDVYLQPQTKFHWFLKIWLSLFFTWVLYTPAPLFSEKEKEKEKKRKLIFFSFCFIVMSQLFWREKLSEISLPVKKEK